MRKNCVPNAKYLLEDEQIAFVCSPYTPMGGLQVLVMLQVLSTLKELDFLKSKFGLRVSGSLCLWPFWAGGESCSMLWRESPFPIRGQSRNIFCDNKCTTHNCKNDDIFQNIFGAQLSRDQLSKGPTARSPIVHFFESDTWAPDSWAPGQLGPGAQLSQLSSAQFA